MIRALLDKTAFLLRDRETRAGRLTNAGLYVLNIVFVGLYIVSTYDLSERLLVGIQAAEIGLAVLFLGEFIVRIYAAESAQTELTNPFSVIDLVAILPVLVAPGVGAGFLRGLHTLRVFRFLRLLVDEQQLFGRTISVRTVRRIELSITILLIFFTATGFIYAVEAPTNSNIENFGDAFYYTVIAVSTVGFGDIVPNTVAGRWVTVVAVLVGFVLVPWQATRLRNISTADTNCPRCGQTVDNTDRYCRRCGLPFEDDEQPDTETT
jgi:voltage-gated potassium channel